MEAVARLAGVSRATVSRVVNDSPRVDAGTRSRVLEVIHQTGYTPDGIARSLARRQSRTLAVMISELTNPVHTDIARGIEHVAHSMGYSILMCTTEERPGQEQAYLNLLIEHRVAGIVLVSTTVNSRETLRRAQRAGIPVVMCSRVLPNPRMDYVRADDRLGGTLATRHLIEEGYRSIAHIQGPSEIPSFGDRAAGYQEALGSGGIPFEPRFLVETSSPTLESGYKAALRLLGRPRPSGSDLRGERPHGHRCPSSRARARSPGAGGSGRGRV